MGLLPPNEEITSRWYEQPMAPANVKTYNPAFDITDHRLITAIITEKGIIQEELAMSQILENN